MRTATDKNSVLELVELGLSDAEITRRTGIPYSTARRWRLTHRPDIAKSVGVSACSGQCANVGRALMFPDTYAYLLGQYLGDGHLSEHRRHVFRLRVTCTEAYPDIIEEVAKAVAVVADTETIGFTQRQGCIDVGSYWKHWPCLFPQHAAGPKHLRPITLEPWQLALVTAHSREFIRGLIHSDGCRVVNRVNRPVGGRLKEYRYTRSFFSNRSNDIKTLFTDALDRLGVSWTVVSRGDISVARADDVEKLDAFVGPKS
jgi:hypothetical protein